MKGIDPTLAFMGVIVVAIAGLGFAINAVRSVLDRLLAAERAADRAKFEHQQAQADLSYDQRLARYEDALARYEKSRAVAPVRKKKAPAPPKAKISDLEPVEQSFDSLEDTHLIDWSATHAS